MLLSRRQAGPLDAGYLRELFTESRDELSLLPAELRDSLADMQYRGQLRQIAADHPRVTRDVLVADGADAGLLVLDRDGDRMHVVDIVVARSRRRQGIATAALRSVIEEAGQRTVTLTVWSGNLGALALYKSFGFTTVNMPNITEGYILMERRPER